MHRKENENRTLTTLLLVGLFGVATAGLTACNTTEGVGEDISAAGDAISDTAEDAAD